MSGLWPSTGASGSTCSRKSAADLFLEGHQDETLPYASEQQIANAAVYANEDSADGVLDNLPAVLQNT